jgi:redox-sensitive bicupin YhaK (pirin superfamily)
MLDIIRSDDRGSADHGWLQAKHTFSFADYQNPERVHFGKVRVINEDRIAPGQGFATHPHNDMEIVTYIISGAIEHKDSMGNGTVISAGEVQRMTAGTGVLHSEFNHSKEEELHLLQIWIFPEEKNLTPGYEQTLVRREEKLNRLRRVGSRDGREGYKNVMLDDVADRRVLVQIISGSVDVNGETLAAGDGVQIRGEPAINITANDDAELLLFNMS